MCESTEQRICIRFCFKIANKKKPQRKRIKYCSKHTVKDAMGRTVASDCFRPTSSRPKKGRQVRSKTKVMLLAFFFILRVSHTASTLPTGKQLTRSSARRSCDVCVNQFAQNDRKNGGMATGSCTTTARPHTLHVSCSSFGPNTALLSCSSRHTHHISHRVTFFYSEA